MGFSFIYEKPVFLKKKDWLILKKICPSFDNVKN